MKHNLPSYEDSIEKVLIIRVSDNVVVNTYFKREEAEKDIIFYDTEEDPHKLEYIFRN